MRPRTIVTALLLAFVGVSVAVLVAKELAPRGADGPAAAQPAGERGDAAQTAPGADVDAGEGRPTASAELSPPAADADTTPATSTVVAYYFHGTRRCATCVWIESHAREAIEGGFGDEVAAGRLSFSPHFPDDPCDSLVAPCVVGR